MTELQTVVAPPVVTWVPCIEEKDLPVIPARTSVDPDKAGYEQLAAASKADVLALEEHTRKMGITLRKCAQLKEK